jgi:predicted MarR family transcription regulator
MRTPAGRPRYGSAIPGSWPCSALCVGLNALGFTNRSLRARVSHLLGVGYPVNQMSYDLARLRRKGLIVRRPGTNTYDLSPDGLRVAIFYTKVHDRLLGPLIAADTPPAPEELRAALRTIERHIDNYTDAARIRKAA